MAKGERVVCQVCGGEFAADKNGNVGRHGFKRPGKGYLVGRCFGEHRAPFPATDALEEAIAHVGPQATELEAVAARYEAKQVTSFCLVTGGYKTAIVTEYAVGVSERYDFQTAYKTKTWECRRDADAVRAVVNAWERRLVQAKAVAA